MILSVVSIPYHFVKLWDNYISPGKERIAYEIKGEWKLNIYAYCRVSTREQNEDRQLIAMGEVGVSV